MEHLKYPVGRFIPPSQITHGDIADWISSIGAFPKQLRQSVEGMSDEELKVPYRPGGWNVRQVVHHCADSHMNAFIRFRLILTEDLPMIKPYDQAAWSELIDAEGPVESSLQILTGLHRRWVDMLHDVDEEGWKRSCTHPEHSGTPSMAYMLALYAWHCRHHLAHTELVK